jgi:NAD+ kinase
MKELRIAVVGRNADDRNLFKECALKVSDKFIFINKNPEIVVSFGGDGSVLYAERKYPSVPKLILRHKSICKKCHHGPLELLLSKIINREYKISSEYKLEASIKKKGQKEILKIAANDIVVSNRLPYRALRFSVKINNENEKELVGDGMLVSTRFGSSGYFSSITRKEFSEGFGVAFNNPTEENAPVYLKEPNVLVEIIRNDAYVSCDNDPRLVIIGEGDSVLIKKSDKMFNLIVVDVPKEEVL